MSDTTVAVRNGELQGRYAWAFRIGLGVLVSVITFTVQSSFTVIKELKGTVASMQIEMKVMQASNITQLHSEQIRDIELRIRDLERRRP